MSEIRERPVFKPCEAVVLRFLYRNYKGKYSDRIVTEPQIWFGHTEWHPEDCYLMHAFDIEKGEYRDFKVQDIVRFY